MATVFTYDIGTDFTSLTEPTPNINAFWDEVDDSAIDTGANPVVRVEMLPDTDWFQIEFTTDLSGGDETTLDGVVAAHTGVPLARDAARDGQTGATTDPTVDNDDTEGFLIGSQWVNTTTDVVFQCVDNSTGAAVWKPVGDVAGGDWAQNGFETRSTSTLTFDDGTRTLSIQPTATDFEYWFEGEKYTTTGDTRQITDVDGIHVIYYDGATLTSVANPTVSQVDSIIRTKTIVSIVYWNTTDLDEGIYVGEERHGKSMAPATHAYLHYVNGLVYLSGLALTSIDADQSGDLDAHAQFGVDAGAVSDEDIYDAISAVTSTTGLPIYYMLGAGPRWYRYTNSGFSVRTSDGTSATRLAYNQYTGGAWQLTEVSSGDFVLCHVFATTEKDNPMIAIMGQDEYANIAAARAGADAEIRNLVLDDILFPESRPVGTVMLQTNLSYANAVNARVRTTSDGDDYVDWRNEAISRTEVTTTDHNSLTGLQGGTTNEYYHLTQAKHDAVVSGPASAPDNAIARYDGTTGKIIQDSDVTLDDSNNFAVDSSNLTFSTTTSGSVLVDAVGTVELNSSGAAISIGNDAVAQSVNVGTGAAARTITIGNVTGATALDFNAGTGGITLDTTSGGAISVDAIGANINVTTTTSGAIDVDGAGAVSINSSGGALNVGNDADAQAINVGTGGAARTITVGNATGATAVDFDSGTGAFSFDSTVAQTSSLMTLTTTGTGGDSVELFVGDSDPNGTVTGLAGSLFLRDTGTGGALYLNTSTTSGTTWTQVSTGGAVTLQTAYEAGNTITTNATEGNVTIQGTEDLVVGGSVTVDFDTTDAISLDADAASNFTVNGANLTFSTATSGEVLVDGVDGVEINSSGGAIDVGNDAAAQAINLGTGAAARTITVGNATGATTLDFNAGTGGITLDTTSGGAISVDAIGAGINVTTTTSGAIDIDGAGAVSINSSGGAINVGNDADAQAINVGTGAAARTITVGNSTGATAFVANTGTGAFSINTTNGESASVLTLTSTGTGGDSAEVFVGDSNPNGSVTGLAGSLFLRDTGSGGEVYVNTSTTSGTTWTQLGTGGSGIGGSTGATDGAVLRADGTGGSTLQNSGVLIDDSDNVTLPGSALRGVGNTEVSPTALSAQANNYDPSNFGTADILRQDLTGTQTITGFAAPTSTDNHRFVIRNIDSGSDVLILAHESGSSTAANRIATPSKLSLSLRPGQGALLWYDSSSSRWVVVAVFRDQQAVVDNGSSGASKTIDWRAGRIQKVQLTANCTFTFTAPSEPGTYALRIAQDATGGRTITWPSAAKWPNGFTPTHPPGASKYCWWIATWDGTNYDGDLYGGLGGFG